MEGLLACLPGKLAWRRRCSKASGFQRHLASRSSSLPAGGGQLGWEAVKQKSVGDEGGGHGGGGAEGDDDGSPPPPTTAASWEAPMPSTAMAMDHGQYFYPVPDPAHIYPALAAYTHHHHHFAAATPLPAGASRYYSGPGSISQPINGTPVAPSGLWQQVPTGAGIGVGTPPPLAMAARRQNRPVQVQPLPKMLGGEEPAVVVRGVGSAPFSPSTSSSSSSASTHKRPAQPDQSKENNERRTTLTNATNLHLENDTEEDGGALLLDVKGISSLDRLCDCVASTKTNENLDVNKDGQANVAKSLTQQKSFTYLRHVTSFKNKQVIEEPEVLMLKFKGISGTNSSILEERRTTLTNATNLHLENDTEEDGGALLLDVKGISSPDRLFNCAASTKTNGNLDVNKDGQADVAKSLTQLFVKVCQKEVSMQEDFNTTTIKELMDSACHKAGIQASDFFATYGGKRLKADKPIAYYPIFKDSTVHLRPRLRAGRDYESETFEELMSKNKDKRFCQVNLSAVTENKNKNIKLVTFLSQFSSYYIHKIMVYICSLHREGLSLDGKFSASDILIVNKTMVDFNMSNLRIYNFNESTCSNDYFKLYEIFTAHFTGVGITTPVYFNHFLNYLLTCPDKQKSNSEPIIHFITNHPSLTSYMDRIKQCILLDSMVFRLANNDRKAICTAFSTYSRWVGDVLDVTALKNVYLYNSIYNPIQNITIVNSEYGAHIVGCLHFARNYFSHADFQIKLREIEAGFAATLEKFLPTILLDVARKLSPADFDILTLLGNPLADSFE